MKTNKKIKPENDEGNSEGTAHQPIPDINEESALSDSTDLPFNGWEGDPPKIGDKIFPIACLSDLVVYLKSKSLTQHVTTDDPIWNLSICDIVEEDSKNAHGFYYPLPKTGDDLWPFKDFRPKNVADGERRLSRIIAWLEKRVAERDEGTPKPVKNKKSTQRGEARTKLIAALSYHHKYDNGWATVHDSIGSNELARAAEVSNSTTSDFFKKEFGGHQKYKTTCLQNWTKIVEKLCGLNEDHTPELLSRQLNEHSVVKAYQPEEEKEEDY